MIIRQKTTTFGAVELELEDEVVIFRQKNGPERLETRFRYSTLLPDADHRASSERKFIYFAAFMTVIFLMLWGVRSISQDELNQTFVTFLMCVIFMIIVVPVALYMRSRFDVLTYFYLNGAVAFSISRNRPDEATYLAFIQQLTDRIKRVHGNFRKHEPEPESDTLSSEIERLASLKEKGYLTDEEFARAKDSLLGQLERGNRVMGFHQ